MTDATWTCSQCGERFESMDSLSEHQAAKHEGYGTWVEPGPDFPAPEDDEPTPGDDTFTTPGGNKVVRHSYMRNETLVYSTAVGEFVNQAIAKDLGFVCLGCLEFTSHDRRSVSGHYTGKHFDGGRKAGSKTRKVSARKLEAAERKLDKIRKVLDVDADREVLALRKRVAELERQLAECKEQGREAVEKWQALRDLIRD